MKGTLYCVSRETALAALKAGESAVEVRRADGSLVGKAWTDNPNGQVVLVEGEDEPVCTGGATDSPHRLDAMA